MSYSKEIMLPCEGRNIRELFMRRERKTLRIFQLVLYYIRKITTVCMNCSLVLIRHALTEIF